jgi:hypothetical protein
MQVGRRTLLLGLALVTAAAGASAWLALRDGEEPAAHTEDGRPLAFERDDFDERVLQWIDREGRLLSTVPDSRGRWSGFRITSEGRVLVAHLHDDEGGGDLWRVDLSSGLRERLTTHRWHDRDPVLAPDNTEVAFASARVAPVAIFRRPSIRGSDRLWMQADAPARPTHWAHAWLVFDVLSEDGTSDIWIAPTDGSAAPRAFLHGAWDERGGRLDPTSRWMVYESSENGQPEIYITTFPDQRLRWLVSDLGGGRQPMWRRSGLEIFYTAPGGRLMAAFVRRGDPFVLPELARELFAREDLEPALVQPAGDGMSFLVATGDGSSPTGEGTPATRHGRRARVVSPESTAASRNR